MSDPATQPTAETQPTANGHAGPSDDAVVARARRILAGDIRPDDYLPVPEEVEQAVTDHLACIKEEDGIEATPAARLYILNDWTLMHHHGGQVVLAKFTDHGVLVLAAGDDQIYRIRQRFEPDSRSGFAMMFLTAP